jgi:hypothetical protein
MDEDTGKDTYTGKNMDKDTDKDTDMELEYFLYTAIWRNK